MASIGGNAEASITKELEIEYKAMLTELHFNELKHYFASFAEAKEPYIQTNYYFDIIDFPFISKGITVRIRHKEDKYLLQIKIPNHNITGTYNQQEELMQVLSATMASDYIANGIPKSHPLIRDLFKLIDRDSEALSSIGCLTTERYDYHFYTDTISLDKSDYLGVTEYELEWETTNHPFVTFELNRLNLTPTKDVGKITRFLARLKEKINPIRGTGEVIMENKNKCWCRELYNLPEEFKCKEYACGRFRINMRNLEQEQAKMSSENSP